MLTKSIEEIKISDLTLLETNPRQVRTGAIKRLAKSLSGPQGRSLFEKRPCLVNNRDGKLIVYAGNQRLRAAQSLKWETVPCIVDEISLAQEREETIKDNLVIGEWDDDLLANNFDLKDLEDWGMDLKELGIEPLGDDETDEVPEPPKEARAERGKVYQLGRHRIMCGDSTNAGDVALLMDGKKADMVFTDPPYGIDYKDLKGRFDAIENDKSLDGIEPVIRSFGDMGVPAYVCCNWKSYPNFFAMLGDKIKSLIVWDKETRIQNLDKFYKQHEFICYMGAFGGQKTVDGDVWKCDRQTRKDHPTAKPIELIARAIRYSSGLCDIVIDLFLGSGSTLIACEQTGRICYGMEIDPKYVDVIIERYCNYVKCDKESIYEQTQG